MNEESCILAFDMGGTYIKAACLSPKGERLGLIHMTPSHSGESRQAILDALSDALAQLLADSKQMGRRPWGVGISTPGPFDFARGRSLMTQKFQEIYDVDLGAYLRERLGLSPAFPIRFIQDANAFLAGEYLCGAAAGAPCCAGVTLGTGLGFSTLVEGLPLDNGFGSPYIALYRQPFANGILEDVLSARGICRLYREWAGLLKDAEITAKEVGARARAGDAPALEAMRYLGGTLGHSIAHLLAHTRSQRLIIGGQISKDFDLFAGPLKKSLMSVPSLQEVLPALHPEDAALYGAAALYVGKPPDTDHF